MATPVNNSASPLNEKTRWFPLFQELMDYVDQHPDINIQEDMVSIPRAKQPDFYELFDAVRDAYIAEKFSGILGEADILSKSYVKVEQEFIKGLGIENIYMPNELKRFLHEPLDQLRREIFDPLFDLICGKADREKFISDTSLILNQAFRQLCKDGYKKWVTLSLLKQFGPEQLYCVPLKRLGSKQVIKHSVMAKESLPAPVKTNDLYFEVGHRQSLVVPDAIIYSGRLNKYVSFRTNFTSALWKNSNNYSPRREWYTIQSLVEKYGAITIRPDLLIYIGDRLEDVSLVADNESICRPDLIIGCVYDLNSNGDQLMDKIIEIKSTSEVLNPTNGSYIISRQKISGCASENTETGVNFLEADLEEEKLDVIVGTIKM